MRFCGVINSVNVCADSALRLTMRALSMLYCIVLYCIVLYCSMIFYCIVLHRKSTIVCRVSSFCCISCLLLSCTPYTIAMFLPLGLCSVCAGFMFYFVIQYSTSPCLSCLLPCKIYCEYCTLHFGKKINIPLPVYCTCLTSSLQS